MRKLVMITSALFAIAYAAPSFAQSAQSAPQPGLPPGAGYMAPNAQPPLATGNVTTTATGMAATTGPAMTSRSKMMRSHHYRTSKHHTAAAHHARRHMRAMSPAAAPVAPVAQ